MYTKKLAYEHFLDSLLEDTPVSIVSRLRLLGVSDAAILGGVDYLNPREEFSEEAVTSLVALIRQRRHSLVVIDSLGEAFGIEGINEDADKDVGPWLRQVARQLAEACADTAEPGPAVVLVDHSTKSSENPLYPSGSKRKRAAIGGASYLLTAPTPPTKSQEGRLRLTCAKDRNGNYARGQVVGDLVMIPGGEGMEVYFNAPGPTVTVGEQDTALVQKVVEIVREEGKPLSKNAIITLMKSSGVKGATDAKRGAIDLAAARGALIGKDGPRGARLFEYVKDLPDDEAGADLA